MGYWFHVFNKKLDLIARIDINKDLEYILDKFDSVLYNNSLAEGLTKEDFIIESTDILKYEYFYDREVYYTEDGNAMLNELKIESKLFNDILEMLYERED